MFCAPDPCECTAKPKKAKAPKRPAGESVRPAGVLTTREPPAIGTQGNGQQDSPPRLDIKAKMKAAAAAAPVTPAKPKPNFAAPPVLSDDQLLEQAALRALAPIMHESERERFRMVIAQDPTLDQRKATWKARRRYELQDQATG